MEAKDLQLEINEKYLEGDENNFTLGKMKFMVTPPLDEEYWQFRVKVDKDQAIVGFPKFSQVGIGFAKEVDWNTNLPSSYSAEKIFNHIKVNKHYASIPDELCIKAIKLIQKAVKEMKQAERDLENEIVKKVVPELFDENGKELSEKAFKEAVWLSRSRRKFRLSKTRHSYQHVMLFGRGEKGYKYKAIVYENQRTSLKRFREMIRWSALGKPHENFVVAWRGEAFDYKPEGARLGFDGSFS